MLLEDHFAASLIPPAISTSLTYRCNLSASHVPNYLHHNTALVHKAPSGQPVQARDILLTGTHSTAPVWLFVPLCYMPHSPVPGSDS